MTRISAAGAVSRLTGDAAAEAAKRSDASVEKSMLMDGKWLYCLEQIISSRVDNDECVNYRLFGTAASSSCRQASKQSGDQKCTTKERGPDKVPLVGIPFMLFEVLVGIYSGNLSLSFFAVFSFSRSALSLCLLWIAILRLGGG